MASIHDTKLPPKAPVPHHVRNSSADSKGSVKSIFDNLSASDHYSQRSQTSVASRPMASVPSLHHRQISLQSSVAATKKSSTMSPFEVEAETGILHAIEETERLLAREAESSEPPSHSRLLSALPITSISQPSTGISTLFQQSSVESASQDEVNDNQTHPKSKTIVDSELKGSSDVDLATMNHSDNFKVDDLKVLEHHDMPSPTLEEVTGRIRLLTEMSKQKSSVHLENDELNISSSNYDPEAGIRSRDERRSMESVTHSSNTMRLLRCVFAPIFSFRNILKVRWTDFKYYAQLYICFIVSMLAVSAFLFYGLKNPAGPNDASWSWWLNFLVRQSVSLMLAQITQFILIDFIVLETRVAVWALGKLLTLLAIQAKGWPLLAIFWATWNFVLNQGDTSYAKHWLYWQSTLSIFSEKNPGGNVVTDNKYRVVLLVTMFMGMIFMVKRVILALILGKKKYVAYGAKLESIMRKILLISEVAILAEEIQFAATHDSEFLPSTSITPASGWLFSGYERDEGFGEDEDDLTETSPSQRKNSDLYELEDVSVIPATETVPSGVKVDGKMLKSSLNSNAKKKLIWNPFVKASTKLQSKEVRSLLRLNENIEVAKLLGEWEIPEVTRKETWRDASISNILQFREGINYLSSTHPLSVPFGLADTRQNCARSAEIVYNRLIMKNIGPILHIETLIPLATNKDGRLDKTKARALIKLFRPDRNGNITLLDFLKSCDNLYKRVVLFRATTTNAGRLDDAFEKMINFVFYIILALVLAAAAGFNPSELFLSMGAIFLPLSFLFSAAASKFFEGLLLVLVRQPFDIGDRIALSSPEESTSTDGSLTWYVENITLFQTTVRLAASNEVATYSNGSLASLRIINANRSPKATVYVYMKFGIDVPYEKIVIFKTAVEKFVKERPREWLQLGGIRAVTVESDLGYIKYVIVLQHVESWQNVGAILQSKADVASFCLEVSKKLDMRFTAPPMPVDLNFAKDDAYQLINELSSRKREANVYTSDATNEKFGDLVEDQELSRYRKDSVGFSEISALFKRK